MASYKQTVVHLQRRKLEQEKSEIPFPKSFGAVLTNYNYNDSKGIHVSVVENKRVVRLIPVSDFKPCTFKYWEIKVLNHLNLLPGAEIRVRNCIQE